jgi:hypothetical protein
MCLVCSFASPPNSGEPTGIIRNYLRRWRRISELGGDFRKRYERWPGNENELDWKRKIDENSALNNRSD